MKSNPPPTKVNGLFFIYNHTATVFETVSVVLERSVDALLSCYFYDNNYFLFHQSFLIYRLCTHKSLFFHPISSKKIVFNDLISLFQNVNFLWYPCSIYACLFITLQQTARLSMSIKRRLIYYYLLKKLIMFTTESIPLSKPIYFKVEKELSLSENSLILTFAILQFVNAPHPFQPNVYTINY